MQQKRDFPARSAHCVFVSEGQMEPLPVLHPPTPELTSGDCV